METAHEYLVRAAGLIADHGLPSAGSVLEQALALEDNYESVVTSLKYTSFWTDRQTHADQLADPFDRGEYLLGQWLLFEDFVARIGEPVEMVVDAVRQHVFGTALAYYREVYQDRSNRDAQLLLRIGRCYKGIGAFDRALTFLRAATGQDPGDASILAELADALALADEAAQAKVFFREAFYLDPQRIDIARLESELILRLISAVRDKGYTGAELREWIPVYGYLYGVFNVKRELRSIEFGRLKQAVYELERELRDGTGDAELLKPRLINRYFWLIDHYTAVGESQGTIEEVNIKIRSVDPDVYNQYVA